MNSLIHRKICLTGSGQEIFKEKIFGGNTANKDDDDEDAAGGEEDGNGADGRKETDVEPTFYHFLPKVVYDNALSSWSIAGVLDLSPGQGELAKASLERRLPYVGICLSETHSVMLKQDA